MKMTKTAFLIGSLFLFTLSIFTIGNTQNFEHNIYLTADYCAYDLGDDTDNSYIEIYYNLFRSQLKYEPDSIGYIAIMNFKITISDTSGNIVDSVSWKAGSKITNLSELETKSNFMISDIIPDSRPPGIYNVEITVANGGNIGRTEFQMDVPDFKTEQLSISNLELAYSATPATEGRFIKSGYKIMPNPSRRFSQDDNVIYLYAEGYNYDLSAEADSQYSIEMDIYYMNGEFMKNIPASYYDKPGNTSAIITGFSIAAFKPGGYEVRLILRDGEAMVSAQKQFFVLQSPQKARQELMAAILKEFPRAGTIETEEDAKKFRDDIAYIANSNEFDLYSTLNLEGKRNFQKDFWSFRDNDPSTAFNEYKFEHYRRLKFVADNYDQYGGVIPGWRTDIGRIYIMYGEPTDVERTPSSIEARGWQRWWYHGIEGGIYFVFIDYENTDTFELVHSSKQNEAKDYNWEEKIKMNVYSR